MRASKARSRKGVRAHIPPALQMLNFETHEDSNTREHYIDLWSDIYADGNGRGVRQEAAYIICETNNIQSGDFEFVNSLDLRIQRRTRARR